jgi:hypothetical protein
MRVILRLEYGRLGNQLFQYAALRSVNPTTLFLSGYEQLFKTFDGVQATQIAWAGHKAMRKLDTLVNAESLLGRLVPKITVDQDNQAVLPSRNRSLLYCPQASFFENNANAHHALNLQFRPDVMREVQAFLRCNQLLGAKILFVHARGGDFYSWPSPEKPGVVPAGWLIAQTRRVLSDYHPDGRVVVIGDDDAVKLRIAKEVRGIVSTMSYSADMHLMAISSAGVLSASEFSWWGSAFASSNHAEGGPFIAPLYWLNHSGGSWGTGRWPRDTAHLTFVDVNHQ